MRSNILKKLHGPGGDPGRALTEALLANGPADADLWTRRADGYPAACA